MRLAADGLVNLGKLDTFRKRGIVTCVIESPQGSAAKYKYDHEAKVFELGHPLPKGLTYPFDWGFIPSTAGEDEDPLDVMVLHDLPTWPGLVIGGELVGVLQLLQRDGRKKPIRNDRLFAVPARSPRDNQLRDAGELSKRLRQEIEQFFLAAAALEDKTLEFLGWKGARSAEKLLRAGQKAFARQSVH